VTGVPDHLARYVLQALPAWTFAGVSVWCDTCGREPDGRGPMPGLCVYFSKAGMTVWHQACPMPEWVRYECERKHEVDKVFDEWARKRFQQAIDRMNRPRLTL
jgi:hypothetical protein